MDVDANGSGLMALAKAASRRDAISCACLTSVAVGGDGLEMLVVDLDRGLPAEATADAARG
jgi:hypothetical protein